MYRPRVLNQWWRAYENVRGCDVMIFTRLFLINTFTLLSGFLGLWLLLKRAVAHSAWLSAVIPLSGRALTFILLHKMVKNCLYRYTAGMFLQRWIILVLQFSGLYPEVVKRLVIIDALGTWFRMKVSYATVGLLIVTGVLINPFYQIFLGGCSSLIEVVHRLSSCIRKCGRPAREAVHLWTSKGKVFVWQHIFRLPQSGNIFCRDLYTSLSITRGLVQYDAIGFAVLLT